jgi:flagella basal body P-ring formation protein FlgA
MKNLIKFLIFAFIAFTLNAHANNQKSVDHLKELVRAKLLAQKVFHFDPSDDYITISLAEAKLKFLPMSISDAAINITQVQEKSKRFTADVSFKDKLGNTQSVTLTGRYEEYLAIPALKHKIKTGYVIRRDDLDNIKLAVSRLSNDIALNVNELIGKAPKSSIQANTPISISQLSLPKIIHKKDYVTIHYNTGSLSLRATGVALAAGHIGQSIKVKNSRSNRIIQAVIVDPGVVKVTSVNR